MFKVHLPATSYLRKQVPFFGTNHFFKALRSPLLKSAGLTFTGEGDHQHHSWAPSDAGLHPDPEVPDHPPWNHHPETGELLEGGKHPIDFVHSELVRKLNMDPKMAQSTLQRAIERYNEQHDNAYGGESKHHLPNFNSNQWRKVFVGPHYKNGVPTVNRQVRASQPNHEGGPTPLITYASNQGNLPNGSTGQWIDSGFIHMNKELGEVLLEMGAPPEYVKSLNFVNHPALLPGSLSGGMVKSINKTDWERAQISGQLPDHLLTDQQQQSMAEQRMHPEVHAHQIPKLLGDPFFYPATSKTSAGGLSGEQLGQSLSGIEHGLSEEELNDIASTRAMRLMFQNTHNINSDSGQGAVKALLQLQLDQIGSDHKDENYGMHLSHAKGARMHDSTQFHKRANLLSQKIVAHMSNAAHKRMMDGMSQEDAVNEVAQTMRNSELNTKSRFAPKEGLREKTEAVIDALLGATGHEKFSLGDIPTDRETQHLRTPMPQFEHHDIPQHWQHRIVNPNEVASVGNTFAEPREQMRPAPSTIPPQPQEEPPMAAPTMAAPQAGPQMTRVMPPGMAPGIRQAVPAEAQFQQQRGLPQGQTFLDFTGEQPQLVQQPIRTSHDVASGIDMIRKKMGYFDGFLRGEY